VGITVGHYQFTDLVYADDAAILMFDQLQADSVLQSLMPSLLHWVLSYRDPSQKRQNVGAGDPPSTILIDGVPVEGVEEFIYSRVLMCYVGLGLPAQ